MRTLIVVTWTLVVLAAGCGGAEPEPPAPPAPAADDVARAETIFAGQACAMCHGERAEGNENGPALADLAPYWTAERLVAYLENPDAFAKAHPDFDERRRREYDMPMPSYAHLEPEELELLARWLMSR